MSRIVVVGASLGGLRAAEQLRSAGYAGELVLAGDEPHLPYTRPPLSKQALAGEADFDELTFRRRGTVTDAIWKLGRPAVTADLAARTITFADGEALPYDGLVIATGVRPVRLPLPGRETHRHVVRTVDDARALRAQLIPGHRLTVIGAGFIGCEVAATARTLGLDVTVVAPEAVPMQRPLGTRLGAELRRRHESHGVRFHLERVPTRYTPVGVVLDDGSELPAEVIVEAVGCRPNTRWLRGNALDLSDGVRCDNDLRVHDHPGVVAVGDVARFPNPLFDDVPRRVEHWNMPIDTARRAARTLLADLGAGARPVQPFTPMPTFWSDQYDIRIQSFGAPGLGDGIRVLDGDTGGEILAGYHRDGVLVGVVALGLGSTIMRYRSRIGAAAAAAA